MNLLTIDEQKNEAPPNPYPDAIIELVKPTIVKAIITKDTEVTKTENKDSKIIGYLRKGEIVEIIRDKLYKRYLVRTNKSEGWVDREVLEIPKEEPANQTRLTKEQAEGFIEQQGLTSKTKYLIWVDIDRQLLNIFIRDGDKWKLYKTMVCATGKNESPTIRGIFKLQDRGLWFYSEAFKAGAKYWVRIQDSYLIHSVPMNKNKQVIDSTLGKRVSSGCIRLAVEDAKWVYYNIPQDTTIYIN